MSSEQGQPAEVDFEKAVAQIEGIIERIESGQIGLERSITEYERGVSLLKRCREVLARAEQRVEDLTARMQADSKSQGGTAEKKGPSAGAAGGELPDEESPF